MNDIPILQNPFPQELTDAIEKKNGSVPIILALLNEISGLKSSLRLSDTFTKLKVKELSAKVGYTEELIVYALSTTDDANGNGLICNFEFDESAWKSLMGLGFIVDEFRLLMSCRLGVSMVLGRDIVMSREVVVPVELWEHTLVNFIKSPAKQVEFLIDKMAALGEAKRSDEEAGLSVLISKYFHPTASSSTPQSDRIMIQAAQYLPLWQDYKRSRHVESRGLDSTKIRNLSEQYGTVSDNQTGSQGDRSQ